MNIQVQNHKDTEFDLADLEVTIKDYVLVAGTIVSLFIFHLFSITLSKSGCAPRSGFSGKDTMTSTKCTSGCSTI